MMKTLNFTAKVLLAVFVYSSMFVSCYDDSAILERLDKLEGTTIKSIEQQISAINTSITSLQGVDQETKATLTTLSDLIKKDEERLDALEDYDEALTDSVAALKEQLSNEIAESKARYEVLSAYADSLSGRIDLLQTYVDSISAANVDWAKASFSTLAQHDSIVSALAGIEVSIRELNDELCRKISDNADSVKVWVKDLLGDYYDADAIDGKVTSLRSSISDLDAKLGASIDSVELWVNEQLSGYYDIATMDAKMKLLKARMSAYADSVSSADMGKLKVELDSARSQLTAGYKKAISEAISTNNGVIDNKIAKEVSTLNDRIDKEVAAINESIAKLEGRVETLENEVKALQDEQNRKLDIVFSDNDISCLAGDVLTIGYTIKNGTPNTKVYTLGENGWKGTVKASTDSTGTISVTVPAPYTDGVILVFVNDDANKTAIRSLNFVQGSMTLSSEVVMADTEGDTLSVDIDTDLEYEISVPAECDWVHFQSVTTRSAMRHEKATFSVDENVMAGSRSAVVDVNRKGGALLYQITIRQSGSVQPANEIWYTSTDGKKVELTMSNTSDVNVISNNYGSKKGVITFDSTLTRIGYRFFYGKKELREISIPNTVVEIGAAAFSSCFSLRNIVFPDGLKVIGDNALSSTSLTCVILSDSLTELGESAFSSCTKLKKLSLPSNLRCIQQYTFYGCGIDTLSLPASLETIGQYAFNQCRNLSVIHLNNSLKYIGYNAFEGCSGLITIDIPKSVETIYDGAFRGCNKLVSLAFDGDDLRIHEEAFQLCTSLTSISFSGKGQFIYEKAFSFDDSLSEIHFGRGEYYLSSGAFENCFALKNIYIENFYLNANSDYFRNLQPSTITLYIPNSTSHIFRTSNFWKDCKDFVEMDSVPAPKLEAIDMGLSVKWSNSNIGGSNRYYTNYQWGSTATSYYYRLSDYKWFDGSNGYTKYNSVDLKNELDDVDDVATYYYGSSCRIPTLSEFEELIRECETENTDSGLKFISKKNGNSIVLPYCERYEGDSLSSGYSCISESSYWSKNAVDGKTMFLKFNRWSPKATLSTCERYYGLCVRPVIVE